VKGKSASILTATVRFLHLIERSVGEIAPRVSEWPTDGEPAFRLVPELRVEETRYHAWQEAEERAFGLGDLKLGELTAPICCREFSAPAKRWLEPLCSATGSVAGVLIREQCALHGESRLHAAQVGDCAYKITLEILNLTPLANAAEKSRDEALLRSLVSAHVMLRVRDGEFLSLRDPPHEWREAAESCRQSGLWPVLVGEVGQKDTVLCSPIILDDYPQVAPESPGDLFDSSEIDELLTLRILTLTDDEKRQMAATDSPARDLLRRSESLAREQLLALHGTMRRTEARCMNEWNPEIDRRELECVHVGPCELRAGDRVRLRPRRRADVLDSVLAGMTATIDSIEQDFEGRMYLAVTLDDDPGKDLGALRQPGHRFFFAPEDVEPLFGQSP
jgi:hypothetical protein